RRHPARAGRAARLFRALVPSQCLGSGGPRGAGRLWRAGHPPGGARPPFGDPVPPREEPAPRTPAHRAIPCLVALRPFSGVDPTEGWCVRLQQGDMARATVFNQDPAAQARAFQTQGFEYLHVVDLDGAFAGKPMNAVAVTRILEAITIPLQLGGGIRDM